MRYSKIEFWNGEEWFTASADWAESQVDEWDDITGDPIQFSIVARYSGEGSYMRFDSTDGFIARLPRVTQKLPMSYMAVITDIATGDFAIRNAPALDGEEWLVSHLSNDDESYRVDDEYALRLLNPKLGNDFKSTAWVVLSDGFEIVFEATDE